MKTICELQGYIDNRYGQHDGPHAADWIAVRIIDIFHNGNCCVEKLDRSVAVFQWVLKIADIIDIHKVEIVYDQGAMDRADYYQQEQSERALLFRH